MTDRPQARIAGFDVARAVAILGMIVVNFQGKTEAYESAYSWLPWAMCRIEGKFAALFVLLAGIGISLRTRAVREDPEASTWTARRALLERAAILFFIGLLNLHVWDWDILHFYGVYLALAALFLGLSNRALWILALAFSGMAILLQTKLDWWAYTEFWTWEGGLKKLFFNGLHPVFPWMAFILVGMWVGRLDLRSPRVRRILLVVAVAAFALAEVGDWQARPGPDGDAPLTWVYKDLLRAWPRPARPGFLVSGTAFSVAMICLAIEVTEKRTSSLWVAALAATGQMAFTIYVVHTVAIVLPLQHGLLTGWSLEAVLAYSLVFYAVAVAMSVWWRRRWRYGPLEGLIRQVTERKLPEPLVPGRV